MAGIGTGAANAAVGDDLNDSCMSFSQDGGATWGDQDSLRYDNTINPIPGKFALNSEFQVKNTCDAPAKFRVLTAFWKVTGNGTAQLRADIDGKTGSPVSITGTSLSVDDAKLVAESGRLTKGKPVSVKLLIGLPSNETNQGFDINPGWGMFLQEVAGTGGGGNGGGTGGGSLDGVFGSLGGSGSLGGLIPSSFNTSATVVANQ